MPEGEYKDLADDVFDVGEPETFVVGDACARLDKVGVVEDESRWCNVFRGEYAAGC